MVLPPPPPRPFQGNHRWGVRRPRIVHPLPPKPPPQSTPSQGQIARGGVHAAMPENVAVPAFGQSHLLTITPTTEEGATKQDPMPSSQFLGTTKNNNIADDPSASPADIMRLRAPLAASDTIIPDAVAETQTPTSTFTCGVCTTPITDETWQSCRECQNTPNNVDFHKKCVAQGRQQHHTLFPGHGFRQVKNEGAEDELCVVQVQPAAQPELQSLAQEGDHAAKEYRRSERLDSLVPEKPHTKLQIIRDSPIAEESDADEPPRESTKYSIPPLPKPETTRRKFNRGGPVVYDRRTKQTKKAAQPDKTPTDLMMADPLTETIAQGTPSGRAKMTAPELVTPEAFATKWLFKFHCYLRSWLEEADPNHTRHGLQTLLDFEAEARLNGLKASHFVVFKKGFDFSKSANSGVETTGSAEFTLSDINVLDSRKNRNQNFFNPFKAAVAAKRLNRNSIQTWTNVLENSGTVSGQNISMMGVARMQEIAELLEQVAA